MGGLGTGNRTTGNRVAALYLLSFALCLLLSGCDPATRHKTLTTLFDGVPSLPPAEEFCQAYLENPPIRLEPERSETGEAKSLTKSGSSHRPYAEKKCEDCHDFGKSNKLIRPATQLCFVCHTDFIQGSHVHGPVSVGDCLACHLPHHSDNPSLLSKSRSEICFKCHQEERLAARMHEKVTLRGMFCVDCHDPHFGDSQFFLN